MLLATRGAEEIVSNTQRHVRLWLRARRQKKHAAGRIQELARKRSTVRRARRPADRLAACCKLQSLTRGQLARAQLRRDKARFAAARLREEKLKETTALIRLTNDEEKETWARLGSELVTLARTIHGLSDKLSSIKRDQRLRRSENQGGASRPGPAPSENEALLAFEAAAAEVSRATFEQLLQVLAKQLKTIPGQIPMQLLVSAGGAASKRTSFAAFATLARGLPSVPKAADITKP